jgi:hypothetical protein
MIVYLQVAAAVAAVCVAFWPNVLQAWNAWRASRPVNVNVDAPDQMVPSAKAPSYRDSIFFLSEVRRRLIVTETLDDSRKKAIDVLTLALVDGSDK